MPEAFQYTILRAVPDAQRGEALNVGVVLYCRRGAFLDAKVAVDEARLAALGPLCDADGLRATLESIVAVAHGDPAGGPLSQLDRSDRFGWIAAPSSTVVRPSPVHTGLTADPAAELARLFAKLVL